MLVFAAAGAPIPLYNTYRVADGLGHDAFAVVSVGYFVAAAVSLLVLGRLSNHVGRRPVSLAALACAAAGSLLLTVIRKYHAAHSTRYLTITYADVEAIASEYS